MGTIYATYAWPLELTSLLNKKPSRWKTGGLAQSTLDCRLGTDHIARLKAFGAFQQIELHGLTLIE
jgi:hypothetical protein